jgi:hypothetical protein
MRQASWNWLKSLKKKRFPQVRSARPFVDQLERRDLLSGSAVTDHVLFNSGVSPNAFSSASPTGYSPDQIRQAYGFNRISFLQGGDAAYNANAGSGQTIAIIDGHDDPNIVNDLAAFDRQFNLPGQDAASVGSFFTRVNQEGGNTLPSADAGAAVEIALDVEWAHAIAPAAKILLVEANSNVNSDLETAIQFAANQPNVSVVSMSFNGSEFSNEYTLDGFYTTPVGHAGVSFVGASGDSGAPAGYQSSSPNVLAVGGSTLKLDAAGNPLSETGWAGSGGGLSSVEGQPAFQKGVVTQSTSQRATPDVAYDADPATGFSIYDTFNNPVSAPWSQIGGTSAGTPQWAALVALADQGRALNHLATLDGGRQLLPLIYSSNLRGDFTDITQGSSVGFPNESAGPGYDLVTGLGSPLADALVRDLSTANVTATTSTVTWTGAAGDGNWDNPANWSGGVVPGANNDVVINSTGTSGFIINHSANQYDTIRSLVVIGGNVTLNLDAGTLDLSGNGSDGTFSVSQSAGNTVTLNGGVLKDALITADTTIHVPFFGRPSTISGGQLDGTINVDAEATLALDGRGINNGTIQGNFASFINAQVAAGWTNNAGGSIVLNGALLSLSSANITNAGTITVTNGGSLDITSDGFVNSGAITVSGFSNASIAGAGWTNTATGSITVGVSGGFDFSSLSLLNNWTNKGTVSAFAGTTLQLGDFLNLSASDPAAGSDAWTNTGTITATSANVSLGGWLTYTATNLNSLSLAGNTVSLIGTLDNRGQTLALGGGTSTSPGSWSIAGGRIDGGTITTANGAALIATNSGGTLDGVTNAGNIQDTFFSKLALVGAWTNATTGVITVSFATIQLGDPLNVSATDPVASSHAWVNNGAITITNSNVSLGGFLTSTATNLNSLSLAGDTVSLIGTLDNRGQTLALGSSSSFSPGSWFLAGGRIDGGTVTSANGAALVATFTNNGVLGTLDDVTLSGTLDLTGAFGTVTVVNGMVLNGSILLGGINSDEAILNFDDTAGPQTLSGSGKVIFGSSFFFPNTLSVAGAGVLTIGSGITIDGPTPASFFGFPVNGIGVISGPIDNKGTILVTADTLSINLPLGGPNFLPVSPSLTAPPVAWTNEGTIHVTSGHLDLGGAFTNTGTITADAGTSVILGDIWNTSPAENANAVNDTWVNKGTITVANANVSLGSWLTYGATNFQSVALGTDTVSLVGTLDNTGQTLALRPGTASSSGSWSLAGGRVFQGTLDATAANLLATSSGGTLDGVTVVGTFDMKTNPSTAATIINNLTLDGTIDLGGGSNQATLTFDDTKGAQTLSGTGTILFANTSSFGFEEANVLKILGGNSGDALTIGGGIFISANGESQITGPIDNQGTILEASGGSLSINFQGGLFGIATPVVWTNEGTIHVTSGSLAVGDAFTNTGTITADPGTSISLGDSLDASPTGFNVAQDGWINTGTINLTSANVSLGGLLSYGPTNFQSLSLGTDKVSLIGTLVNTGHTLTLTPGVTSSSGSWLLVGGRVFQGILATTGGAALIATPQGGFSGSLDGVTLDGTLDLSTAGAGVLIENGLTLNTDVNVSGSGAGIFTEFGAGPVIFSVGSLVSGATIKLSGQGATLSDFNGGSFALEPGITVAGGNSSATILGSFDNKGTIQETAGGLLDINFNSQFTPFGFFNATPWTNEGTIHVSSGSIRLGNVFTNNGQITADSGTGLALGDSWNTSPAESFLAMADQWFNLGTITTTNAQVLLGGWLQYTATNLQSLSLAGDAVTLIGTLDNTGHTLALGSSASFSPGSWSLGGGRIYQGTVTSANGAALIATSTQSTLDGVTLDGTLDMRATGASVHVINNLTLNGLIELGGAGGNANLNFTTFFTPETISGNGSIQFGAGSFNVLQANASFGTLTLGSGITLDGPVTGGQGLLFGAIDNKGTIQETLGGTLDINFDQVSLSFFFPLTLTNGGTAHVSNGTLRIGNAFANSGTITADAGTSLVLGDDWNTSPAESFSATSNAWVNTGTITATGVNVSLGGWLTNATTNLGGLSLGTDNVSLIGTLANSGNALALKAGTTSKSGSWNLAGGRVFQGTVDASSAPLVATARGGTLDGVTLGGALDMQANAAVVNVLNSLTLNGTIKLGGASGNAALNFNGFFSQQTLGGTGSVVFGSGPADSLNVNSFFPLTLASGITLLGGASDSINGPINNQGTIEEATADGVLTVGGPIRNFSGGTLTGGTWEALNGGVLQFLGDSVTTNAATIVISGSGSRIESDRGTTDALARLASNVAGASLTVGNAATVSTTSAVSNAGALVVQVGGAFRSAGDYTQTAGATTVDGTLTAGNFFLNGGTLNGTGTVQANLTNAAEVDPGHGTGTLTIGGNYTQTSAGVLNIEIVDSGHFGQLAITGTATLGGTLNVLTGSYVDSTLDSFKVLTFQQRSGTTDFATRNGLALADGQTLNPTFHTGDLTLVVNNFVRSLQNVPSGFVLLATFTVNGPVGVAADYTATVEWGDGSHSSSDHPHPHVIITIVGKQIIVIGEHTWDDGGLAFPTVTLTNTAGQSVTTPAHAITVDVATDVTDKVHSSQSQPIVDPTTGLTTQSLTVTAKDNLDVPLAGAFDVVLADLTEGVTLQAATISVNGSTLKLSISITGDGDPMIAIPSSVLGSLAPGQSFTLALSFSNPSKKDIDYSADVFSDPFGA